MMETPKDGPLLNSLKTLYKYTIGSCIPLKCSNRCIQIDGPQNVRTSQLEEPAAEDTSESSSGSKTATQIIKDGEELIGEKPMKEKVNLHFENHIQKWKRQKFPWKVLFHILLVVSVTVQVSGQ